MDIDEFLSDSIEIEIYGAKTKKQLAKKLIRERLEGCDDFFYVKMLGYCGDVTDIPLIDGKLKVYKDKNKNRNSDFTYCIRICKEIIKTLKSKKP